MKALRFALSVWLFDLAARIYPLTGNQVGQAHHVGQRWLTWSIFAVKNLPLPEIDANDYRGIPRRMP